MGTKHRRAATRCLDRSLGEADSSRSVDFGMDQPPAKVAGISSDPLTETTRSHDSTHSPRTSTVWGRQQRKSRWLGNLRGHSLAGQIVDLEWTSRGDGSSQRPRSWKFRERHPAHWKPIRRVTNNSLLLGGSFPYNRTWGFGSFFGESS